MEMNNVLKELFNLKVAVTYEKKKQYNAAGRHRFYHNMIQWLIIIIGVINSSTLVGLLKPDITSVAYFMAIASLFSAALAGIQKVGKYDQVAERNLEVADQHMLLTKEIDIAIALYKDTGDNTRLVADCKAFRVRYGEILAMAKNAPTNKRDYRKAQQGIASGEESYSESDMNIGQQF